MAKSLRSNRKRRIRAARRVKMQPKVNQQIVDMLAASKAIDADRDIPVPEPKEEEEEKMAVEDDKKPDDGGMEVEGEAADKKSKKVNLEKLVPFMSQRKLRKYTKSITKKTKKKRKGIQW